MGYIPLSYPLRGALWSERGGYPKGLTGTPWARWWDRGLWATPSCCCCCVVSAACRAVIVRWDLMNGTWDEKRGGVDARAAGVLAFPHQTAEGCLFTRVCRTRCFCTKSLQFLPISIRFVVIGCARRDASVAKVSAESERNEGRFQCFFTKPLQFRPILIRFCEITCARRDASVYKVSAESERNKDASARKKNNL